MRYIHWLLLGMFAVVSGGEEFHLRYDKTGVVFGPFDFKDGAEIQIGPGSFTIIKNVQPELPVEKPKEPVEPAPHVGVWEGAADGMSMKLYFSRAGKYVMKTSELTISSDYLVSTNRAMIIKGADGIERKARVDISGDKMSMTYEGAGKPLRLKRTAEESVVKVSWLGRKKVPAHIGAWRRDTTHGLMLLEFDAEGMYSETLGSRQIQGPYAVYQEEILMWDTNANVKISRIMADEKKMLIDKHLYGRFK